jgi:hypothetical protein
MGHDEGSTRRKAEGIVTKACRFYPVSRHNASIFFDGEVFAARVAWDSPRGLCAVLPRVKLPPGPRGKLRRRAPAGIREQVPGGVVFACYFFPCTSAATMAGRP